jgi:hypothetical protein
LDENNLVNAKFLDILTFLVKAARNNDEFLPKLSLSHKFALMQPASVKPALSQSKGRGKPAPDKSERRRFVTIVLWIAENMP